MKNIRNGLVATALVCSLVVTPVFATPSSSSELQQQQSALEQQKNNAQSQVNSLQSQLTELMTKMNDLETKLIAKGQEISKAQEDLVAAEEKETQQYEDLKLRIRYMYEEGNGSAMERIFSSGSIAEMLAQAEYVQKVHKYDRDQLQQYQETVEQISDLKATLESDMSTLQQLEGEYKAQSDELSATIANKSSEVADLNSMIQQTASQVLAAQQEEAAAAAAAQQAAAQQAAAQSGGSGGGAVSSGGGGGAAPSGGGSGSAAAPAQPSYNPSTGNAVVDRAYSWVGNAEYVWGACSPGAFDCSGFVAHCLTGGYSRLGTTYTFLTWPQVSDPQPGDVCVNANHCGIYIGGGQMIHAATFGVGVIVGPVQSGMIYVRY